MEAPWHMVANRCVSRNRGMMQSKLSRLDASREAFVGPLSPWAPVLSEKRVSCRE